MILSLFILSESLKRNLFLSTPTTLLKLNSVPEGTLIDEKEIIDIKGVTSEYISSLGVIEMKMYFGDFCLSYKAHVVPNEFDIPASGILGKDFLKDYKCSIDYGTMTLTIVTDEGDVILNIWEGPESGKLVLPPRSEVVRHFRVTNKVSLSQDQVVHPVEVMPDVMIARSIFNPNTAFLRVINLSNETKVISDVLHKSENLSSYDVFSIDEVTSKDEGRKEKVKGLVGKDVPSFVRNELLDLCGKYADIFALATDKMTVNNFYE